MENNLIFSKEKREARKELIKQIKDEVSILEIGVNLFGLTPTRQNNTNKRYVKVVEFGSLVFDIKTNRAFWNGHSGNKPLDIYEFIMVHNNCAAREAINLAIKYYKQRDPRQMDIFLLNVDELDIIEGLQLPRAYKNNEKIIQYLSEERSIDKDLILKLIKNEQLYEDTFHNCVFIGADKDNEKRFGFRRGTYQKEDGTSFKRDCAGSHKLTGFVIEGNLNKIIVTESVIDGLSWKCLHPEENPTIICSSGAGCVANTLWYNLTNRIDKEKVKELVIAVDNDDAGHNAIKEIEELCRINDYQFKVTKELYSEKDLNAHLQKINEKTLELEKEVRKQIIEDKDIKNLEREQ